VFYIVIFENVGGLWAFRWAWNPAEIHFRCLIIFRITYVLNLNFLAFKVYETLIRTFLWVLACGWKESPESTRLIPTL